MENKLREILNAGGMSVATRISSRWGLLTELAAQSGAYDYVEYLGESAPFAVEDYENLARACELHGMGSIVKIDFQNRAWTAQKALAAGMQGILFADCKTPEEVRECICATMPDAPQYGGRFGSPNYRGIGGRPPASQLDYAKTLKDAVRLFMIEKKEAVDNIEEICRIPGVDIIQFGPSDYSMSCGVNLKDNGREAKEAEKHCIRVALAHGVAARCEIDTPEAARYYLDLGVKHFCLGDQVKILRSWWAANGGELRKIIGG